MQNEWAESAAPATRKRRADLDTPLKYCACHAKRENDLPSGDFEAPKRAFRARLPRIFTRLKLRIDDFMRVFLINLFSQSSKNITFCEASASFQGSHQMLRLPRLLTLRHVHAAQPMRFMKKALSTRHCCACHANAKRHIAKCCACHAKVTRWYWHASKVLHLPRKTRKWPPIWRLWSAKTSISCETSFKFHTAEQIFQNTSGSSPQWQWINELTTTSRRRPDDEPTTTRQTRREHRSNPRPQL